MGQEMGDVSLCISQHATGQDYPAYEVAILRSARPSAGSFLAGARQLRLPAALAAAETMQLDDAYHEALNLLEGAALGVVGSAQPAPAQASGRERIKWAAGAMTRALEQRDARLR